MPRGITDDQRKKAQEALRAGKSPTEAAKAAGISYQTALKMPEAAGYRRGSRAASPGKTGRATTVSLAKETITIRVLRDAASEIDTEKLLGWLQKGLAAGDVIEHSPDGLVIKRSELLRLMGEAVKENPEEGLKIVEKFIVEERAKLAVKAAQAKP
jgi:transposase